MEYSVYQLLTPRYQRFISNSLNRIHYRALVDPITAAITIALAMGIGVGYKVMTFGFPAIFIAGVMIVRGLEAAFISWLVRVRKSEETKSISSWELVVMGLGAVFETVAFFVFDCIFLVGV